MSIFGVKKNTTDNSYLTLRVNDLHKNLQETNRKIETLRVNDFHKSLQETNRKIENRKSVITISAETKGTSSVGKVFSFGNAGVM